MPGRWENATEQIPARPAADGTIGTIAQFGADLEQSFT